jgi:hypothetical protein
MFHPYFIIIINNNIYISVFEMQFTEKYKS